MLAVLVGIICCVSYVARLGFVANLLSKPILIGYMTGVALIMIVGQLGKISGISIHGTSVFEEVGQFVQHVDQIHGLTLVIAGFVLVFLLIIQRWWTEAPGPLFAALIAMASVAVWHLDQQGVVLVGNIPTGLPDFRMPKVSGQLPALVAAAFGIAIVGYSDNVLTARAFAARHHYKIDANQELLALGLSNLGSGFMQGFPVSSSGSRTAIADSLGSKTQLFSLVAFGVVVIVLLFFRPVLALFPKAALGAIVIFAAFRLIEIPEFVRLYQFRRSEFFLAIITVISVLVTDILTGVAIAVGLSVIELLSRLAHPHDAVQGSVPDIPGLHDIDDWQGATTIPGLVIYRYDPPLCFANAEDFKGRAMRAIESEVTPVEWFVLNMEAIVAIDITATDVLEELLDELTERGITFAMTRVKHELYSQLKRSSILAKMEPDRIYWTLHGAIAGFESRSSQIKP